MDVVGGFGVTDSSGHIEDGVESVGGTDPVVHLASGGEALGGTDSGVDGAREGADGGGKDLQVGLVGAVGQGLEALDEGAGGGGRLAGHTGEAEVVYAEVHQDVSQAGNRENVAVEARQRVLADLVPQ